MHEHDQSTFGTHSPWMNVPMPLGSHDLPSTSETDVCIVGAGIAGLTTAYLLASAGERVVVLENGRVLAKGTPQEVMDAPAHETLAQLAGFENFFTGVVTGRRPDLGVMQCRLNGTTTELEIPLADIEVGAPVRVAIRAGDILLANQEPRGLSARNVLPGTLVFTVQEGPTVVARIDAGIFFTVHLTPGAMETLHLRPQCPVWLVVKTHSCRLVAL